MGGRHSMHTTAYRIDRRLLVVALNALAGWCAFEIALWDCPQKCPVSFAAAFSE